MVVVWSVKGGVGVTVVAAGLAIALAAGGGAPALLVDLAGDQLALFGAPSGDGPGLAEWSRAGAEVAPDALARIEQSVHPRVALLSTGDGPLIPERVVVALALLRHDPRPVVVDAGVVGASSLGRLAVDHADRSLLVTRACPLALARLADLPVRPSGVVVVRDHRRALRWQAVADAGDLPVVAELDIDPAVGAAVDAGLGARPLPRSFLRALAGVA